ncbi:ATP-dependent DNA helicase PIF1-like protein [Tanacetum coccineum]
MRLGSGSNSSERKEIQDFADWILNIENGKIGGKNDGEANVEFHDDMLILDSDDHIGSIIHETYPDLLHNIYDPDYFQERAILAPNHELVDMINDRMLSLIHGDEKTYNSFDTVGVADVDTNFNEKMYTEEFLNNLNMAGIPHHSIKLKIAKIISGGSVGTVCTIPRMSKELSLPTNAKRIEELSYLSNKLNRTAEAEASILVISSLFSYSFNFG